MPVTNPKCQLKQKRHSFGKGLAKVHLVHVGLSGPVLGQSALIANLVAFAHGTICPVPTTHPTRQCVASTMRASSTDAIPPHPKTPQTTHPVGSVASTMCPRMAETVSAWQPHDISHVQGRQSPCNTRPTMQKRKKKVTWQVHPVCDKRCIYIRAFSREPGQKRCYSHVHINWVGNLKQLPSNFTTAMNLNLPFYGKKTPHPNQT